VTAFEVFDTLFRKLNADKERAVAEHDFERAARCRNQAEMLKQTVTAIIRELSEKNPDEPPVN
jgi:excinuclease UvrABC nuclease subunit